MSAAHRGDHRECTDAVVSAPRVMPESNNPVAVDFGVGARQTRGRLWNISTSGIGVNLTEPADHWDVGNRIELVIHFPGQLPLSAHGKIRHRTARTPRDEVIGIQFTGLEGALKNELGGYVNARL